MGIDADNTEYLENLYHAYLKNSNSVSAEWKAYFAKLQDKQDVKIDVHRTQDVESFVASQKQAKVHAMIEAYRLLGHLHADIDPLHLRTYWPVPEFMLSYYQLSEQDLNTFFEAGSLPGAKKRTLKDIIQDLKQTYCGSVASEFMHIPDSAERIWVQEKIEHLREEAPLAPEVKHHILECLTAAEGLEKYLGAKYPGAKRFSLEGTDSLLVGLEQIVQLGGEIGLKEIVIGMAHRGRLNVLVNLLGKSPSQLFDEFENKHNIQLESGDVKYHQGFASDVDTKGGPVHLALAFNPSHLEIVTPVVTGSVLARQKRMQDLNGTKVLCVALHGDASFSGQGVVMEILNMARIPGFSVGGTLHIVINNQIGFTTNPLDGRSTLYCSDIGKMLQIPIFHVNANDPEALYRIINLSLAYRNQFKKDVIIDLVGYRRHGHNEADEPAVTQPEMYQIIKKLPTCLKSYTEKLIQENQISGQDADQLLKQYQDSLDSRQQSIVRNLVNGKTTRPVADWKPYHAKGITDWRMPVDTAVPLETLKSLAKKLESFPSDLVLHPRVKKIMDDRRDMTEGKLPLDWGYAEIMAYATLLHEGTFVRLSGQDCGRGTFFHRHAVLHNQDTQKNDYIPLNAVAEKGRFMIIDSLLSESAVLGFEYGFSSTLPDALILWEAQFGDFANNAQVVIDQFISSGEQKWGRLSGLTLLLPHGYEGMGAEHSSARLERFLQLCAKNNMQVCVPTTPAQIFHLLRRQVLRPMRKPLIVLTPKSLLRHKLAVSRLNDLGVGAFQPVIASSPVSATNEENSIKRVILCSGKIYYELWTKREEDKRQDVAIIRVEQLYPFPDKECQELLLHYKEVKDIIWCQEEPHNQGAWYHIKHYLTGCLQKGQTLSYAGRPEAAAPAVGYHHLHEEQQIKVVDDALGKMN